MLRAEPVRLLLVAKYPVVCAGLRSLLRQAEELEIAGEVSSVRDAVAFLRSARAEVIVVDLDTLEASIAALGELGEACDSRILVFSATTDVDLCVRVLQLGASGVVSKSCSGDLLRRAILKVEAGELWLDRSQTAKVLSHAIHGGSDPERAKIDSLTKREREIVSKVGEALKNSAIAEQLFISEATVRNHLTSILGKLGLTDRFELAVYAFRHRLVPDPAALPFHRDERVEPRYHTSRASISLVSPLEE